MSSLTNIPTTHRIAFKKCLATFENHEEVLLNTGGEEFKYFPHSSRKTYAMSEWWRHEYLFSDPNPSYEIVAFCESDFADKLPIDVRDLITKPLMDKFKWEQEFQFINWEIRNRLVRRDTFNCRETYEACGIQEYFNEEEGEVWVMFSIEQERCIHKYYWDSNNGRKLEVCGEEDDYIFGNNDITDDRLVGFDKYGEYINRPNISPYFPISNLYYNR